MVAAVNVPCDRRNSRRRRFSLSWNALVFETARCAFLRQKIGLKCDGTATVDGRPDGLQELILTGKTRRSIR